MSRKRSPETIRDENLDWSIDQFVPFVFKQLFDVRIDQHDPPPLIQQHNSAGRGFGGESE